MVNPVATTQDRSICVPPGYIVRTAYVSVWNIRLACRERMAVGDIAGAFTKLIQLADHSPFPCPNGTWEGEPLKSRFVINDGRHEYIASLMLGKEYILVAWTEEA